MDTSVDCPAEGATAARARLITISKYAYRCLRVDLTGETASGQGLIAAEYLEIREWKDWPDMEALLDLDEFLWRPGIGWASEEHSGGSNGVRINSISADGNMDAQMGLSSVQTLQT